MRLRNPGLPGHVEVQQALRPGRLGDEHAALERRCLLLLRRRGNVMRANADRIVPIGYCPSSLPRTPCHALAEHDLVALLDDFGHIDGRIGEDLRAEQRVWPAVDRRGRTEL